MKTHRSILEKNTLTDNLFYQLQMSSDEERIFLVVDYMDGKFIIEKNFKNNYIGLDLLDRECEKFNTEAKVTKYLGLGEKINE